jgi:two-component system phosphate regulon sensor histidine kinase PhoR
MFANTAARRLLTPGIDKLPLSLDGRPIIQESTKKVLRELRKHGHYMFEMTYGNRTYLTMITPLQTGGSRGFVAIMNDISQLKELDRMKNEMVRMTSHDLKNPLQAALANLDLAKEELLDAPNPEIAQSLDVIEHQLSRMNRIIRGILDVERARTGMYTFVSVDPGTLLHHAVDELQHLIESSRVSCLISVDEGVPHVFGDAEQLRRAVVNLLENALKFTPAGGSIALSAKTGSLGVVLSIADTGVGIPEHVGDRVFERFYRVNQSGTEHITGSGLGLSLVKTIVEQHQGRVWFTSVEGKGTTFFIELPVSDKNAPELSQ